MQYLVLFFILIIIAVIICQSIKNQDIISIETFNINYKVKNDEHKHIKVSILSKLNMGVLKLLEYFKSNNYFSNSDIEKLCNKYNKHKLSENLDNEYTAYSVNKGQEIKLCLIDPKTKQPITDLNTTMFVLIHELAHIMTKQIGHPPEFWNNMKILLQHASNLGIYTYINYRETPVWYCGEYVNDTPYIK